MYPSDIEYYTVLDWVEVVFSCYTIHKVCRLLVNVKLTYVFSYRPTGSSCLCSWLVIWVKRYYSSSVNAHVPIFTSFKLLDELMEPT